MNFYGSELWYKARDNSDKYSITIMPSSIESFTKLLEENELCYYGFDNGKIGKISVNKSDIDLIKSLVGQELAAVMKIEEISKQYTPPEKNVFGTVEYKYIAKKTRQFLTGESETEQKAILRTAELLKRDGIKFSGRAYDDKVTLTLNEQDMEKATAYYKNALDHTEKLPDQIEQDRISENIEAVIDKMIEMGFSDDQIQSDYPVAIRELSSFRNVDIADYLMYLNADFTVKQNKELFALLKEIYESGGFDLISPSAAQERLYQLDKEYKLDVLLREYFEFHSFNDEQKAAVREICIEENSLTSDLKHINETFSPAEIRKLHELWQNNEQETADKLGEIEQYIKAQQEGRTGIGYSNSFTDRDNGTVLWTHRSYNDEKGESFRNYTVTYKEILLAKSLFDNAEDMLDYISKTAVSYETKTLSPDVLLSYRVSFTKGEMHTAGDAAFFDRVAHEQSKNMDIFTLDDLAVFIAEGVDRTLSEDQLRQLIEGKTDELLSHGGVDEKLSGYSRSDVLLLCSELRSSPFADKISSNLTEKVKTELLRKGIDVVKEKSFAEQVDEVLSGKANRYNDLKVCDTPQVLLDIGFRQLPMFYTQRHLRDALKAKGYKGESIHHHGLSLEQIKGIPTELTDPVLIYDSLSRNDSIVVVTSTVDKDNMPIIAVIRPNGQAHYNLEVIDSNFLTSIYGRNNFENQVNQAIEDDKLLFINKEKSQELFRVLGLQLSKGVNSLDFVNHIIHKSRNIVNSENEDNESFDPDNSTSVPMDTKLDNEAERGSNESDEKGNTTFDRAAFENEYDDPDYFEQQRLADEEEAENALGANDKDEKTQHAKRSRRKNAVVSNVWSDFEYFDGESRKFGVAEIDKLMKLYDGEIADRKRDFAANGEYYPTYTMEFTIDLPDGRTIEENRELGTGVGGLIDFLKSQGDIYADVIPQLEQQIEHENEKPQRSTKRIEQQENGLRQLTLSLDEPAKETERTKEKEEQKGKETNQPGKPSFQDGNSDIPESAATKNNAAAQEKEKIDVSSNYRITDEHIGEGTKSERFNNNIAAIKTLKTIESENRLATPDEQEILAKYVGWGGLSECFVDRHHANAQLRHNLTDEEYAAARESTMTAFYTPPVVMQSMYKKLSDMGFEGGRILEPSCGVGSFIGTMPEEMQRGSDIHAVELDSISGRIAQKLYPAVDVQVKGFEKTRFGDNSFDVAVGNVPFGDISVRDKQYDKHNWRIHNYFFGKSLDKVRPGGVVAFLTSRYTLDSKNSAFRQYLAERADLLGAVRLPTGTFSKAAGTEVVSDIIFLQKRDEVGMPEVVPDWVQTTQLDDGFSINKYFDEHPEMVLGEIQVGKGMHGRPEMIVKANEREPLSDQLDKAMQHVEGTISERTSAQLETEIEVHFQNEAEAPENLRNYSLFVQNDQVYFKKDDEATLWAKSTKSKTIAERAKAFIGLRDMTRAILDAMVNDCSDAQLNALQQELSKRYDDFKENYGIVHSRYNRSLFGDDISYQLVAALESKYDLNVDPPTAEKSDLFTKRTIRPPVRVTSVDTAQEALAISMAERGCVDFDLMTELYEVDKETIINELQGQIFPVPELSTDDEIVYQERSEYLSGDIRQKLNAAEEAAQNDPQLYSANIKALKDVLPEPLKAGDIDAKIGGAWIDPKYYEQFMYETFKTPTFSRRNMSYRIYDTIELSYSDTTNAYSISHKSSDKSVFSTKTFGMDIRGASAYDIFENLLNFRDTKIYMTVRDAEGNEKRVVDPEQTKLAANKAKKIQEAFSEWIFKDPERREYLVNKYNEMYNSIRPREYDGSALTFPGMNAEITLREHQKDAIAHAIYGGNTLFDHSVGAGKTFEMIASVMERKRLGLSNKALMCVPNHLTEQIGDDFQKLYPNANILVATKNDFSKNNRRALISKIATGDYDAVIIGHTQLGMIPLSKETQEKYIQDEVDQLTSAIAEMKKIDGKSFGVKEAEKRKKNLQKQLDDLQTRKDDLVTFEELGVDTLVLDEAHEFKNLHTPTNMQNVSGIGSAASKKASDLYMKCQYLNEKTGSKGLIFATGTPISNSVTELFTMQRYLQSDVLKAKRLSHFDQWIGMFGHKVTDYQIDPTGKKFKLKTRIAKYTNMTELMSMFKSVADIKTADMMKLDVPECETNIVNVEPTQLQQELVEELAFRADKVENGSVDPTIDNFLKITSDGRKVGLDPRLIDPDLEDDPNTKLNKCVENVFKIYEDTAPNKLTQLIFCDLGVPNPKSSAKSKAEDDEEKSVAEKESFEETGPFCIYDDIKSKLIAKGVKPDEIAFIHDAKTEDQKAKLFEKVRNGDVRVLIGSTPKMGTGTNIQTRLAALHDLDVPWRPADLEQRLGRMVRQGNMNKHVKLFRYVTKGTFDAYSYQTLENKQRYISQLYTGNSRTCEDVDQQSLSYSEIKTLCTGDERLKEVMQLDNDISNLAALKRDHTNTVYEMQDKIKSFQKDKAKMEQGIEGVKKDMEICSKLSRDKETGGIAFEIKIDGVTYTDKTEAAKQLERVFKRAEGDLVHGAEMTLASMYGFDVKVKFSPDWEDFRATVSGNANYSMRFSEGSHPTNIKRLMNIFDGMKQNLQSRQDILARQTAEANEAQSIASTPFPKDAELSEKIERRDTLKAALQAEQAAKAADGRDKQRTFHFSVAELKRNSKKVVQSKPPDKPQYGASALE